MKKKIRINDLIFEKIKFRYHFFRPTTGTGRADQGKLLLDSMYPGLVARGIRDEGRQNTNLQGGGYAISERVSEDMGARRLHISDLITMLGYTKTDISKLLQKVKNRELNIALIGLGGTGSNFLHWLYEMSEWTGKNQIFLNIAGFDDDDYDVPNMLRIPFIPQFNSLEMSSKKTNNIPQKFRTLSRGRFEMRSRLMTSSDMNATRLFGHQTKTFVYGAPNIAARAWLSKNENFTFFAATHRDNQYSIVENPDVDNDLMMETYGKINLSMFFLNHLSMTIDFLKYIVDRADFSVQQQNETVVSKDFGEQFEDKMKTGFKAGSKKFFVMDETRPRRIEEINLPERNE